MDKPVYQLQSEITDHQLEIILYMVNGCKLVTEKPERTVGILEYHRVGVAKVTTYSDSINKLNDWGLIAVTSSSGVNNERLRFEATMKAYILVEAIYPYRREKINQPIQATLKPYLKAKESLTEMRSIKPSNFM